MKQIPTILMAIICQGVFAQIAQNPKIDAYIKLTLPQYQQSFGKIQAEDMRLVGYSEEVNNAGVYQYLDSAQFFYDDNDGMQILDLMNPNFSECFIVHYDDFNWEPYAHMINLTDVNDRRTSLEIFYWDGTVYISSSRYFYTYDDNWNVIEVVNEYLVAGVYENGTRTTYTYTLDGVLDYYVNEGWTGTDWEAYERFVYTYNPNGFVSTLLEQDYDGGVYVDDYRYVYVYDEDNKLTTSNVQQSDGLGGFEEDARYIYTYDASDFLTVSTLQFYDGIIWEDYLKTEHDNNDEGLADVSVNYYWDGTIWEPELRVTNTYESYDNTGVINMIHDDIITLSPNPAEDKITIYFPGIRGKQITIQIFNNEGRLIATEQASNIYYHTFHLASLNLTPGIYHIELLNGDLRYTKSFEKI